MWTQPDTTSDESPMNASRNPERNLRVIAIDPLPGESSIRIRFGEQNLSDGSSAGFAAANVATFLMSNEPQQPEKPKKPYVKPGSLDNARANAKQAGNQSFDHHLRDHHTRSILKRLRNRKSDLK